MLTSKESLIASRFNQEYRGEALEVPDEVQAMPIYADWQSGKLDSLLASPFWDIQEPKKNQPCLDIGCGVSFLVYPWREWKAYFYGQEISNVARDALMARGPQLNSKLFKGVKLGSARKLEYENNQFELAIATGWSCYYPLDYWREVMKEAKRVLQPDGHFVFDILNPDSPLALDWAVLQAELGTEVFLESLEAWTDTLKSAGAKVRKQLPGELFTLYRVSFPG